MPSPPRTTQPNVRVVLCDDVAAFRALMRFTLEDAGFDVVGEAADGAAGVDTVASTQPDLVLLDLAMPGTDGLTALPQIRMVAPDAQIVVLSGFTAEDMACDLVAGGASAYVEKGTDLDELIVELQRVAQAA